MQEEEKEEGRGGVVSDKLVDKEIKSSAASKVYKCVTFSCSLLSSAALACFIHHFNHNKLL
jgi:hypothetical protein